MDVFDEILPREMEYGVREVEEEGVGFVVVLLAGWRGRGGVAVRGRQ